MERRLRVAAVAAGLALAAIASFAACTVKATLRVYGQPVVIVKVDHEHSATCGHEFVWYDGHATYWVDGRWLVYAPDHRAWVAFEKPSPFLRREEERLKRGEGRSKAVPYGRKLDEPGATKAPPATAAPGATKAPPAATAAPSATKAPPPETAAPSATKAPPAETAEPAAAKAPPPETAAPSATKAPPKTAATKTAAPSAKKAPPKTAATKTAAPK